ncbi:hypothetical protein Gogos_012560 [Gossypium gossypioides]|uniref:Uncharacterized protein n=1 Tax=Gossypium gossypioides TaxID=34282 RepID=A0A7J9BSW1_GOSGO|nr:hypothetical protein [Gossypium gossypioides]
MMVDLVLVDCDNEEVEEIRTKASSSGASKRFYDNFLCSVLDYLVGRESEAKAFLDKITKHRKIWLQKFSQG